VFLDSVDQAFYYIIRNSATHVCRQQLKLNKTDSINAHNVRPTQPSSLSGMENKYRPKCGNARRLGSKDRYCSFINVCHTWALQRGVSHDKAIPKSMVMVTSLLLTQSIQYQKSNNTN